MRIICFKLLLELLELRDSHTYNINKKVKWRSKTAFPTGKSNWIFQLKILVENTTENPTGSSGQKS